MESNRYSRRRGTKLCETCGRWYSKTDSECIWAKSNLYIFQDTVDNIVKLDGPLFIDLLYHYSTSGCTIKEFAVTSYNGPTASISVRPTSWLRPLTTVGANIPDPVTGFRWMEGIIDEQQLQKHMKELLGRRKRRQVYVNNQIKANALTHRLKVPTEVITIIDYPFNFKRLCDIFESRSCPFHRHNTQYMCAMRQVQAMCEYSR